MTTTGAPATKPVTDPPTDLDWANHTRWSIPPVGTRRQYWVDREAQAIFTARTGRADPFPSPEDYAEANRRIPA